MALRSYDEYRLEQDEWKPKWFCAGRKNRWNKCFRYKYEKNLVQKNRLDILSRFVAGIFDNDFGCGVLRPSVFVC